MSLWWLLVAGVSGHIGIMSVEAVGCDARINGRLMLASRQLSNSAPLLLCIWFTVDLLEVTLAATHDISNLPCYRPDLLNSTGAHQPVLPP